MNGDDSQGRVEMQRWFERHPESVRLTVSLFWHPESASFVASASDGLRRVGVSHLDPVQAAGGAVCRFVGNDPDKR